MRAMHTPSLRRRDYLAYAALAVLFAISATYRALDVSERVGEVRHGAERVRDPFDLDLPQFEIVGLEPEAEQAGLRRGDTIRIINGNPVRGTAVDIARPLRDARVGDRLAVTAARGTNGIVETITASIVLQPLRPAGPSAFELLTFAVLNVTLPTLCAVIGFWVAAVRVRDVRAWLLLFLMLSLAEFSGANFRMLYGRNDFFQPIAAAYQPILANLWPTAMLLFALYFPHRLPLDRRFGWVKWIAITPVVVRIVALNPVFEYLAIRDPAAALTLHRALEPLGIAVGLSFPVFIALFLVIMGYRTFSERDPDARRRLRLLNAGAVLSLTPACIFLVFLAAGRRDFPEWLAFPILGFLFIFPLTMAHGILVHRAMDVRVVIRQGLQYLLASAGVRVLAVLLSVVIIFTAVSMSANPAANRPQRIAVIAGAFLLLFVIRRFAERLRRWVDRRFFREAYDAERILSELASRVRTMVEMKPLLEMVTQQIATSLHVPRVAILLNAGGVLEPAYAVGYAEVPRFTVAANGLTEDMERELRDALDAELVLPLSSTTSLLGVMGLGPKQSEEPFTSGDIRLLGAVAAQTGLALENTRLTAEIATEIANREKAKRELEIAREVQERLFPQDYPPVPGIEYEGACRPALGVGGDYYDFIKMSDTDLGLAIGDVSGKGMPAALLMATLRAYLRGQTIRGESDLGPMMANLNQLVYESSATNRYATFFYGHYDATTRTMRYVNAGHNPPMVFRKSRDIVRLDIGGPVIGLIVGCTYEEGEVQLQSGDVLVAFTDGVSEAMNSAYEEWGEDRLAGAVQRDPNIACRPLIELIMCAADAFVSGAPQHDDMTLVILRQL
jgi:phosphoserine phosphatase RsbU/P